MSAGNQVSKERLFQIASRKLSALGIPSKASPDGQTLLGRLELSSVVNPINGTPLGAGAFFVVGHDQLSFTEGPLAALGPVPFYDCDTRQALELRLASQLAERLGALKSRAGRLTQLKLPHELDADLLLVRTRLKTATHLFELLLSPRACWVSRFAPLTGKPLNLPSQAFAVNLDEHPMLTDLELFLVNAVPQLQQAASGSVKPPPAVQKPSPTLTPLPAAGSSLTLAALQQLGTDMAITSTGLELTQDFAYGQTRYRFVATHVSGTTFKARLLTPSGEKWSDKIDLTRFPGAPKLVASLLGVPAAAPAVEQPIPGIQEGAATSAPQGHLAPVAGEVWVMNVLVEAEQGEEVRYVCMDIDGRPYGAARVLKRVDFEAVFSQSRGAWRLLIVIEAVQGEVAFYRQLDRERQPRGVQKSLKLPILLSNFLPEAAAY